jgi:hypothetical protein
MKLILLSLYAMAKQVRMEQMVQMAVTALTAQMEVRPSR